MRRLPRLLLVVAFAVALGHMAWHAMLGPPPVPSYVVGGDVDALCAADRDAKNLYLRRTLYLPQRPRHAWIQVLGRDQLEVYANGRLVQAADLDGFPVAVIADLTPYLKKGTNVIAIAARQASPGHPPAVAVEGACVVARQEQPIEGDCLWRCQTCFDRTARWWFETDFNDAHWPVADHTACFLQAKSRTPPRAVTEPLVGSWITPPRFDNDSAAVRREFEVPARPRQAWLRVTALSAYRLAVNGIVLDQQEDELGTAVAVLPVRRVYDITAAVQSGRNVVSLLMTGTAGLPHLHADLEIEDAAGQRLRLGADQRWISAPGTPPDWLANTVADPAAWKACHVESGDLDVVPAATPRRTVVVELPAGVQLWRAVQQGGLMLLIGVLVWIACSMAESFLCVSRRETSVPVVYLALVLPTLALAAAVLATYDPRIAIQDVYRGWWVALALLAVLLQWALLALMPIASAPEVLGALTQPRAPGVVLAITILVVAGFWLRVRDIDTEPLHWDEITGYGQTHGVLETGFPGHGVGPDTPFVYTNTSELVYIFNALPALVFDNPNHVMRVPSICWSTLSIVLIYVMGRTLFGSVAVGLVAATIYTFSPTSIAISTFGRYFGLLQFFTLLTVYFLWLTVRGTGPLSRRWFCLTTVGFIGVFLSWEGGALMAPSMVLATLWVRRGRLHTVIGRPMVYVGLVAVALVVVLQLSHRDLQQTQSIWYGISASDASLRAMWPYAVYQPWFYIWEASWNQDALLPLLGLLAAGLLAVRSAWQEPLRFLLIIFLTICALTAAGLSLIAWRYSHHLTPLFILPVAAALVHLARQLLRWAAPADAPAMWQVYGRLVAGGLVAGLVVLSSGLTLQLLEMDSCRIQGYGLVEYKYGHLQGPAKYLDRHVREGDLVLAHAPFVVNHFLGYDRVDYWVHSKLHLPETLDEHAPRLLDRRDGTPTTAGLPALQDLFARHRRVWYVVLPASGAGGNRPEVSAYLRQHMDIVYEDYQTMVLLRDDRFRPTALRRTNQAALERAAINLLP